MSTSNQRYSGVHYNRNGTYWQMRWVDNSGKRQTEGAGKIKAKGVTGKRVYSERQVKVMCKQKEAELAKNPAMIDKRDTPTLSQWCAIYESERHMMTTKTVTPITELTEKLTRYFNLNLKIYEINRNDAANWRTWMRTEGGQCSKPLAESTVCKYVRQAKHMFREAVERDLIAFNPFGRLKDNALLPQDTPETPPTNNTALKPIGSGMTWQDAKEKLETHVKAHNGEFSNVNNLAKIIGCSRPTIKKSDTRFHLPQSPPSRIKD